LARLARAVPTDNPTLLPRVSFIIPTLNVEALLTTSCRPSRARRIQCDRYEILLADAHSTDRTREIAKKYGAIVLDDDGKNMEEGKRLAAQHATGEFIVFVGCGQRDHPRRLHRTRSKSARRKSAGAGRGKLLFAIAENEFVLRLPHAPAAHQRSDCLADEHESETCRARG